MKIPSRVLAWRYARALFAALIVLSAVRYGESADLTYYVASTAQGDGSGSSPANAASYMQTSTYVALDTDIDFGTDSSFWSNVKSELATNSVTVQMAPGTYPMELALSYFGNFNHQFTLQGDPNGGTVFNAAANAQQRTGLYLTADTNMTVKNLNFTGANFTSNAMVISSDSPSQRIPADANLSQKIVLDGLSFTNLTNVAYGALEPILGSKDISIRNSTFSNVGFDSHAHMIYDAYSVSHISMYNNTFTDVPGDFVRFRDQADYGTVINNTFLSTKSATAQNFIGMPLFNDVDPNNNPDNLPMELFPTHFTIANNNFHYSTSGTSNVLVEFTEDGYNPPGTEYLPTASEGAILTGSNNAAKSALLKSGMGIDTTQIHFYGNTTSRVYLTGAYVAEPNYNQASRGWTGLASIGATFNTAVPSSAIGSFRANWAFGAGEGWTNNSTASLTSAGWVFRTGTTGSGNNIAYVDTTKTLNGASGVLFLGASATSDALVANYSIQRLVTGEMDWRMGMSGAGSGFGLDEGRVDEGGLAMLDIQLLNSNTLHILNAAGIGQDITFSGVDFSAALNWRLLWSSDPDGVNGFESLSFQDTNGLWHSVFSGRPYDANVVPDTVWFQTGANTTSNYVFLDSLSVTVSNVAVPEPSGFALLGIAVICFGCAYLQRHRRHGMATARFLCSLACAGVFAGCSHSNDSNRGEVYGTVRIDGEPIESGAITFVPTNGTVGPTAGAVIENGKYHVGPEQGPPLGDNLVRFRASKATGRKVPDRLGEKRVDEYVDPIPPSLGDDSKLVRKIQAGKIEINFELSSTGENK